MASVAVASTLFLSSSSSSSSWSSSSSSSSPLNRAIQITSAGHVRPPPVLRSTSGLLPIFPSIKRYDPLEWRRKDRILVGCLPSTPPPSSSGNRASPPPTRLYISGLSFHTTQESLRNVFQNFGQILELNLVMDRIANRPRGFAFVRYSTADEAKMAIEAMHGKFLDGRVIFVEVSRPRSVVRREKEAREATQQRQF